MKSRLVGQCGANTIEIDFRENLKLISSTEFEISRVGAASSAEV